jgi:hypothetical protein
MTALQRKLSSRTVRLLRSARLRRKRRRHLRNQFNDTGRPLLLMLQMPKTGSQTVEATLRKHGWEGELGRVHFVSPGWVAWAQHRLRELGPESDFYGTLGLQVDLAETLLEAARARIHLRRAGFDIPRLHVISAVRETIGLALSWVFEGHEHHFPNLECVSVPRCAGLVQQLRYLERFQNWFDTELKPLTEIDVFQRPFPHDQGFDIYENDLARVLVYRFESFARIKEILETFLGREVREVVDANLSARKPYSRVYAAVKTQVSFPPAFLQAQFDSKMMRHFYSAGERQSFQTRWSQR